MLRIFLVAAVMCLSGVGCAQRQPASAQSSVSKEDNELIQTVYMRLQSDPVTSRLELVVQASDGIVTMYGRIDNAAARLRAVSVVRSTVGVRGVIDKTFKY